MSKQEKREWLAKNGEMFGSAAVELAEIRKMEAGSEETDLATLSVGCTSILSLVCC